MKQAPAPAAAVFNLARHFSLVSLILIGLAGALLGFFYYQISMGQLLRMAEDRNVAMTQVFRNTLWPRYGEFLRHTDSMHTAWETGLLHAEVVAQMRDTDIVKAKVYNRSGLTVYSSDPKQIGENKSGNPGFQGALAGHVRSELTHRNSFDAFEGTLSDLDVISSYVPIHNTNGEVEGVFELYQNVTSFLTYLRQTLWWIAGGVLAILACLYLLQFLVVHRAHNILRRQESELEDANRTLDSRVRARTQELEETNARLQGEITERRATEMRLDHLAHHDPLTGLPNRLLFSEQLEHSLKRAERQQQQIALLFIDLDRFKDINDSLGHSLGDELLDAVSKRLLREMRSSDLLARLGGDDFICLVEDIRSPHDASAIAQKIHDQFSHPFAIGEHELLLSASIGICLFPGDGDTVDTLLRNADTAMYRAKSQGRNGSHFYAPEMTVAATERLRLEALLRRSIENGELSLAYQAQVDSISQELLGAEALVRWNNPELGQVSPARFIPVAEESGFIVPLGEWVLREACRQMAEWDRQGLHLTKISVNLSVKQLERANIVDQVTAILGETGISPDRLELEITESVIMAVDNAVALLEKLRQSGIKLSIDDFGTGYSSLSYLKLLPIDKLKIDRAFVTGIGENGGDEAIIRTIVALAHSLGLELIAEGVEEPVQADFLASNGCQNIQGYLYGRPLKAADFAASMQVRIGSS